MTINSERLGHGARSLVLRRRDRFASLEVRLKTSKLSNAEAQRQTIARHRERTLRLAERSRRALSILVQRQQARVGHSGQLLAALSYRSVLARGFALVRDEHGVALRAATAIGPGARLDLEFADGRVAATADADRPAVTAAPARPVVGEPKVATPKRVVKPVGQGSLF